jgi:hypothetical protein
MAFDWKLFAGSFLNQVTEGIEERGEEAKKFKVQQEEAAERNQSVIRERNARARQAAQYGSQAEALLANMPNGRAMVRQAMASGMGTIQELYEKLQEAANAPGQNGKLGQDDIEAIVNMPSIPPVDKALMDMSLEEYAKQTYGASSGEEYVAPQDDTSLVGQLFGFGARDRAKEQLAKQDFGAGFTVGEINRLAKQEEYTSLIPGATMMFTERNMFDTDKAFDFSKKITKTAADALKTEQAERYIKAEIIRAQTSQKGMTADEQMAASAAAERQAIKDLQIAATKPLIDYYADVYHTGKFFENKLAVQTIASIMGEGYVDKLKEEYSITDPVTDTVTTAEEDKAAEVKEDKAVVVKEDKAAEVEIANVSPRPKGLGMEDVTEVRAQLDWDAKYEGKYDPETGQPIIVEPRPAKDAVSYKYKGVKKRKVTVKLYKEWMKRYGDTHNPDGTPKPVEE